jgi:hypothetical protein
MIAKRLMAVSHLQLLTYGSLTVMPTGLGSDSPYKHYPLPVRQACDKAIDGIVWTVQNDEQGTNKILATITPKQIPGS